MATVNLGVIKPVFKGAYNNSTAYVLDNIVTSGGSSYICILASTGNAVSNATYWSQMSAIGTNPQLSMTWDNATADADNGAGKIAWNHATIASATILYVDDVDDAAASIATYVQSWDDVANATAKGIVTITKEGAPAVFATFKVTGSITDASGYSKIPVTHLVSAGSFSDGDGVAVSFAYSGVDGADGTDASTSASDLTSGTLPMARLSGTLPALSATNLTNIPTANLTSGAVLQAVNLYSNSSVATSSQNRINLGSLVVTPVGTGSKFVISFFLQANFGAANMGFGAYMYKDGSAIAASGNQHSVYRGAIGDTYMGGHWNTINTGSTAGTNITFSLHGQPYNSNALTFSGSGQTRGFTILEIAA